MSDENENQYVVLARKYRPQNFEDLLGQDALVQTLTNAIKNNRLHHAYILTGIRGVGKTTTARLIARALNCTGLDGKGGPTIHPCGACENCQAIAAGRHIDVMELDAASRTGVDDIRELLDGVRYKPTNARYKIYIIDEVHMLSKGAFNALLKTLEEPPAHVKFIFATTEIRKVPVTVLSRCQRFDLQRLSIDTLLTLFHKIVAAEKLEADEEALKIVARAADGSARDGLSLLDQAIVLGDGKIKTSTVSEMIGLADRAQTLDLFEQIAQGNMPAALNNVKEQYKNGAQPLVILQDLIDVTHLLARAKIVPETIHSDIMSESEKELCKKLSGAVSIASVSRLWQIFLKGLQELNAAPQPVDALEMILIRAAYASTLPTPKEILEDVKKNSSVEVFKTVFRPSVSQPVPQPVSKPVAQPIPQPQEEIRESSENVVGKGFEKPEEFMAYLEEHKKPLLLYAFKNDISIEQFQNGYIKFVLSEKASPDFEKNLKDALFEATGAAWVLESREGELGRTIADQENEIIEQNKRNIMEDPLVKTILNTFKGARIDTAVRKPEASEEEKELDLYEEVVPVYEEE